MGIYALPSEIIARIEALTAWCLRLSITLRTVGAWMHADFTAIETNVDAAALPAVLVLANSLKARFNAHIANLNAHVIADAVNVIAAVNATDQATAQTLLNELKTDFNAHILLATVHYDLGGAGGDAAPAAVATANATDLATAVALANALKAAINRHFSAGAADPTVVL